MQIENFKMSTDDNVTDLGFLSQYVPDTNGQLNDSIGATGGFSATLDYINSYHYYVYVFDYPVGLQEVTITVTVGGASAQSGGGEELKDLQVLPVENLVGGPQEGNCSGPVNSAAN
jgi:hypothetical protein